MGDVRVVVTGMGTVNPLGSDVSEFWKNCVAGVSGISKITHLFSIPEHMSQIAGTTNLAFKEVATGRSSRNQLLAEVAVKEALDQSGLLEGGIHRKDVAVLIATAIAEIGMMELAFDAHRKDKGHIDFVPESVPYGGDFFCFNNVAQRIASDFSIEGRAVTVSTGCTGGNDAVGYALNMIRSGRTRAAITGAVEAPISPLVVAAFSRIRATSLRNHDPQAASRPYDVSRDGFVLAEGCGILVLENLEDAERRRAPILAEVAGFASVNNHYHMTDIHQDGAALARSCELALKDAQVSPEQVDFVNAHGSSTPQNDIAESSALHSIFGEDIDRIPVTSIKSQLGHPLSAASGIELISAILSMRDGVIPPTINLVEQDHRCSLKVVGNNPMEHRVRVVMKPSSGFSGIHSCIILKEYYGSAE